jgi:hypothetical protein
MAQQHERLVQIMARVKNKEKEQKQKTETKENGQSKHIKSASERAPMQLIKST